jgi:uroporphyrinogen decarboxylase
MTGKERMLRVLKGMAVDRIPVALHNFLMAGRMLGLPFDLYPKNGELLAKAQLHAWRTFGHDVLMIENGVAAMAEAIGCEVAYSAHQPPHVKTCVLKNLDDIDQFAIPDPETTFPLSEMLKAVRLIREEVADNAFIMGRADQGPMALAISIYGTEKLIMDIASEQYPQKVHALIDFCTRCTMRFATALHKAGADGTCIGGMGISLVSPSMFREYELPYQKKFVKHCHAENFLTGVHTCGHEDPILEDLASSGADWLELDPSTTPEKACEATKNRCAVLGMINPVGTLLQGTPEGVKNECLMRLQQMKETRFIPGPGCAIPADCPSENIAALVKAVHESS